MFIPESYLEKESEIVEGFDPEVTWVTQGGYDELEEQLAVRPTSESIITPFIGEWTRSHRDLPMRLNQWCSVCRWEVTETKPFFRRKEFLWQEGHTAHASADSARDEVHTRLDQYQRLYEDMFAIPVLRGRKPEHDKFPGAETTTTIEVLMPDGKSVQGATSHNLGTSFAEAYDVTFVDENQEEQHAHTASWALSWWALGALIMTHSDDQGLVLPPAMASTEVAIVPICDEGTKAGVLEYATQLAETLEAAGIRVELDDRENRTPGYKFNEHEFHDVPLRIEVGPQEVMVSELTLVQRPGGATSTAPASNAISAVDAALEQVHTALYNQAEEALEANIREAESRAALLGAVGEHGGYVKTLWCGDEACEAAVKEEVSAEIVMVPFEDGSTDGVTDDQLCAVCGEAAQNIAYFAQSH